MAARLAFVVCMLVPLMLAGATPPGSQFDLLAEKAKKASAEGRLEEAALLYGRALVIRPQWKQGWWSLGTLEYDQDHYTKAALAFQKLVLLSPRNGTAHVMLGLCQFELGKDSAALKSLKAGEQFGILKDVQLRNVALYHLGVLQLRARKFGDAQETLQELAKQRLHTKDLLIALGESALLLTPQEVSQATVNETRMVERVGESRELAAAKEFDQAKQIFTELVKEFPDYPNLHFAYGRLFLDAHDTDEAIQEFQHELERDPNHVNSMLEIASVQYQADSQAGLAYAEKAVKIAPELPFAHYMLGLLRLDTGDAAGAIPEMEAAKKFFPHQPKVYFSLGNAYAKVGRKADAAKARAEFVRLQALAESRESNIYGDLPSGVSERQMKSVDRTPAPQ